MSEWQKVKLNTVTSYIKRGISPEYVETDGHSVINQKCIRDNRISYEKSKLLNKTQKINKEKYLQDGDILVNSTGTGTLGRVAQYKKLDEKVFCDSHISIVRANELINKKFLSYYLSYSEPMIENYGKGATNQMELSPYDLGLIKINLPPLSIQQKIVKILSDYDDLIEINLKRIKLLEDFGRLTYEEWFLRYRIDGKKLNIDSVTDLPFGWKKKSITECDAFSQDKRKIKKFEGEKKYYATADIIGTTITSDGETINWDNKPSRAQIKPNNNTVWFARMSNTYKVLCFNNKNIKLQENSVISSGFAGFKAKNDLCLSFLYFTINSKFFHELKDLYATGATQVSLNNDSMRFVKIIEPSTDLVEDFGNRTLPLIEEISILKNKNYLLKEAKDILLPRLMTEMIDLDNIEVGS